MVDESNPLYDAVKSRNESQGTPGLGIDDSGGSSDSNDTTDADGNTSDAVSPSGGSESEAPDPDTGDTTTRRLRDDARSDPMNPQTETTDVAPESDNSDTGSSSESQQSSQESSGISEEQIDRASSIPGVSEEDAREAANSVEDGQDPTDAARDAINDRDSNSSSGNESSGGSSGGSSGTSGGSSGGSSDSGSSGGSSDDSSGGSSSSVGGVDPSNLPGVSDEDVEEARENVESGQDPRDAVRDAVNDSDDSSSGSSGSDSAPSGSSPEPPDPTDVFGDDAPIQDPPDPDGGSSGGLDSPVQNRAEDQLEDQAAENLQDQTRADLERGEDFVVSAEDGEVTVELTDSGWEQEAAERATDSLTAGQLEDQTGINIPGAGEIDVSEVDIPDAVPGSDTPQETVLGEDAELDSQDVEATEDGVELTEEGRVDVAAQQSDQFSEDDLRATGGGVEPTDEALREAAAQQSDQFDADDFLVDREGDVFVSNQAQREAIAAEREGVSPDDVLIQERRTDDGEVQTTFQIQGRDESGTPPQAPEGDVFSGAVSGFEDATGVDVPGEGSLVQRGRENRQSGSGEQYGDINLTIPEGSGDVARTVLAPAGPVGQSLASVIEVNEGRRSEEVAGEASDVFQATVVDPAAEATGDFAASESGDTFSEVASSPAGQAALAPLGPVGTSIASVMQTSDAAKPSSSQRRALAEGSVQAVGDVADVAGTGVLAKEGAEVAVEGVEETVQGRGGEYAGDVAGAGALAADRTARYARENPEQFVGMVVGGAVVGSTVESAVRSGLRGGSRSRTELDTRDRFTSGARSSRSGSNSVTPKVEVDVGRNAAQGNLEVNVDTELSRRIQGEIDRVRSAPSRAVDRARQLPRDAREVASQASPSRTLDRARQLAGDARESAARTAVRAQNTRQDIEIATRRRLDAARRRGRNAAVGVGVRATNAPQDALVLASDVATRTAVRATNAPADASEIAQATTTRAAVRATNAPQDIQIGTQNAINAATDRAVRSSVRASNARQDASLALQQGLNSVGETALRGSVRASNAREDFSLSSSIAERTAARAADARREIRQAFSGQSRRSPTDVLSGGLDTAEELSAVAVRQANRAANAQQRARQTFSSGGQLSPTDVLSGGLDTAEELSAVAAREANRAVNAQQGVRQAFPRSGQLSPTGVLSDGLDTAEELSAVAARVANRAANAQQRVRQAFSSGGQLSATDVLSGGLDTAEELSAVAAREANRAANAERRVRETLSDGDGLLSDTSSRRPLDALNSGLSAADQLSRVGVRIDIGDVDDLSGLPPGSEGSSLGSGGTGSLMNARQLDAERGRTDPGLFSRLRSDLERDPGPAEYVEERLYAQLGTARDRTPDTDSTPDTPRDFDLSRSEVLEGSPRDQLSQDIADRSLQQRQQNLGGFDGGQTDSGRTLARTENAQRRRQRSQEPQAVEPTPDVGGGSRSGLLSVSAGVSAVSELLDRQADAQAPNLADDAASSVDVAPGVDTGLDVGLDVGIGPDTDLDVGAETGNRLDTRQDTRQETDLETVQRTDTNISRTRLDLETEVRGPNFESEARVDESEFESTRPRRRELPDLTIGEGPVGGSDSNRDGFVRRVDRSLLNPFTGR